MGKKFQALADKYYDEIVATAQDLIRIRSLSNEEGEMAAYVEKKMRDLGYDEVEVDKYGNVFGTIKGTGNGKSVALNCHMDVVDEGDASKWPHAPYAAEIADGKIWGRGASDTKGTMAIEIYVPAIMKKEGILPKGDMTMCCVVAEENSGYGSMMHTLEKRHITDYAILGEATENNLAIGSRGRFCVVITIHGKACHASIPHTGKNPFDFAEILMGKLHDIELGSDELFGSSTMTLTKMESSEKGTNLVPNDCTLYYDYRSCSVDTMDVVLERVQKIIDSVELEGYTVDNKAFYFPMTTYTGIETMGFQGEEPFAASKDADYVLRCKAALEEEMGREIETYAWAFATDAGHYTKQGVKCIGYSPAEIKFCHTTVDQIDLEMLREGIDGTITLCDLLANEEA